MKTNTFTNMIAKHKLDSVEVIVENNKHYALYGNFCRKKSLPLPLFDIDEELVIDFNSSNVSL